MIKVPEVPEPEEEGRRVIRDGYFEKEFHLTGEQVGEFLVDMGEQLKSGDRVTISSDDWELPFTFREPVELEVEFEGGGVVSELEVEVEFEGKRGDSTPTVS